MGLKIGWMSASPQATTGYGTQTLEVCSRLLEKHQVTCMGNVGPTVIWGSRQRIETPHGTLQVISLSDPRSAPDIIEQYAIEFGWDILIGFMDLFGIEFLNAVKLPVIGYAPIDGIFTQSWKNYARNYWKLLAYSRYGYGQLLRLMDPRMTGYIPHIIDTDTYSPVSSEERAKLRESLEERHGIPRDGFLALHVGANVGARKCHPLLMRTFSRFAETHPDSHLFIYTNAYEVQSGHDLLAWRIHLGMEDRIHFPSFNPIVNPTQSEKMANYYRAADVYVQNSAGEGFGLPIAEAMSCGRPVIVPDNSAQLELGSNHGWIVRSVDPEIYEETPHYVPMVTEYPVPNQVELRKAFGKAYRSKKRGEIKQVGDRARKYIVDNHSFSVVMPRWFRFLESVEQELSLLNMLRGVLTA